jgi:mannose-6-phosphate isomerase
MGSTLLEPSSRPLRPAGVMQEALCFHPVYRERVWGGRALESTLGRVLPEERQIGESWEIVDRPEVQSIVAGGALDGLRLRTVIERHARDLLGPEWPGDRPFPLLVKWLDCRERLSLQVHPTAAVAARLGGEPKTENWYIAHTVQGAQLLVGLKRGVSRQKFERAIADNTVEECLHRFPVAAGDSIFVRSGQVHAIDAGNLILEVQQNSDTTYRVHDWGRVGLDGKPRPLHIAESLDSILWDNFESGPVRAAPTSGVLAECDEFLIRRVVLGPGERLHLAAAEQPRILSAVNGDVVILGAAEKSAKGAPDLSAGRSLSRGSNALLPYAGEFTLIAAAHAIVLLTENFA